MQRFIENVSMSDAIIGRHYDAGLNSMLIRLQDPATEFRLVKYQFKEIYEFEFLDAEDSDGFPDECKISDEQAEAITSLLQRALDKHMNVVVHCHAGLCRSGAVVEVASMMGFTPVEKLRIPNLRVKHKMMKALGLTYDADEKQEAVNGKVSSGDIIVPSNNDEWN